jgi:hypothetical protein
MNDSILLLTITWLSYDDILSVDHVACETVDGVCKAVGDRKILGEIRMEDFNREISAWEKSNKWAEFEFNQRKDGSTWCSTHLFEVKLIPMLK